MIHATWQHATEAIANAKELLKESAGSGLLKVLAGLLGFAASVVLGRTLGVADFGIYAAIISAGTVLTTILKLGLDQFSVREVAASQSPRALARSLLVLSGSSSMVAAIAMAGLLLFDVLGPFSELPNSVRLAAAMFAASQVLLPVVASIRAGLGRVVASQIPHLGIAPGVFLLSVVALSGYSGGSLDVTEALSAQAVGGLVALGAAAYGLHRVLRHHRRPTRSQGIIEALPSGWARSALVLAGASALFVLSANADILMLSSLAGAEPAGKYRVATRGAELVTFGILIVRAPLAPRISRAWAEGDRKTLQSLISHSGLIALVLGSGVLVVLLLRGDAFVGLFGADFTTDETVRALAILSIGQYLNVLAGPTVEVMTMTGHERLMLKAITVSTALNIALNFALIPAFGIVGASVATGTSLLVWNWMLIHAARRKLNVATPPFMSHPDSKP